MSTNVKSLVLILTACGQDNAATRPCDPSQWTACIDDVGRNGYETCILELEDDEIASITYFPCSSAETVCGAYQPTCEGRAVAHYDDCGNRQAEPVACEGICGCQNGACLRVVDLLDVPQTCTAAMGTQVDACELVSETWRRRLHVTNTETVSIACILSSVSGGASSLEYHLIEPGATATFTGDNVFLSETMCATASSYELWTFACVEATASCDSDAWFSSTVGHSFACEQ